MPNLKSAIRQWLPKAPKVALLGVGSELRGDDGAGVMVARSLDKKCRARKFKKEFKVFIGETAPENLTGEIKRFKPSHLIIIDSADVGLAKGEVQVIDPQDVGGFSSSTHNLPMKIFADYVAKSVGCKIIIMGIQPGRLDFGAPLSPEVKKTVKHVSDMMADILSDGS